MPSAQLINILKSYRSVSNSHIKKSNVIPTENSSDPRKGKKKGLKNPLIFCSVYLYIILDKKDFSYYLNFLKTE